jgi:hypothetical protein
MGRVTCIALAILLSATGLFASQPGPAGAANLVELEPNGGFDNATWFTLSDRVVGSVGYEAGDVADYFRFNVSKQQEYTLGVFVEETGGNCGLSILRPSRSLLTYTMVPTAPYPWNQQRNVGEENGTWYLCVRGTETTYTISSSGSAVANDQPPTVAIASPANDSEVASTTVAVSGTASDDHYLSRVFVYPEGAMPGLWTLASGTASWSATVSIAGYVAQDRSVRIVARAEDDGARYNTTTVTLTFTGNLPPADPPRVDIISPEEGAAVWGLALVVRGLVTDSRPVLSVDVSPDGTAWTAATVSAGVDNRYLWNTTLDLTPGAYMIRARATDALATGNATVNVTVMDPSMDRTPPSIAITSPAESTTQLSLTFAVNGTAADDSRVKSVWVWVPTNPMPRKLATTSDGWANWTVQLALPRGSYVVNAQAEDLNGNVANASRVVNVNPADDVPPRVNIISPRSGDHLGSYSIIRIEGNASDDVEIYRILIDVNSLYEIEVPVPPGTTFYNWTAFTNLTYYGGSKITVSVSDKAGNVDWDEMTVYRDNPRRSPGPGAPLVALAMLAAVAVAALGRRAAHR